MSHRPNVSLPLLMSEFNAAHRRLSAMLSERADDPTGAAETLLLAALLDYDMSPSMLADRLGLTRGRMTHLADSLERRNLIVRRTVESDRRQRLLSLTPEGVLAAEQAKRRVSEVSAQLVADLGAGGVDMLAQQFRSIGKAWTLYADDARDETPAA